MIISEPIACITDGISANKKAAKKEATTGSQSLEAETKEGEKYLRHQLKMLCPKMVEKTPSNRPTIGALNP